MQGYQMGMVPGGQPMGYAPMSQFSTNTMNTTNVTNVVNVINTGAADPMNKEH